MEGVHGGVRWGAIFTDGDRRIADVLEDLGDAGVVVRLVHSDRLIGALGGSRPDAAFAVDELEDAGESMLADLPADPLTEVQGDVEDDASTAFASDDWYVLVRADQVEVVSLHALRRIDPPENRDFLEGDGILPGPPICGGINVSCRTCGCRVTVPAKLGRTCPCQLPPPDHQLSYGP